MPWLRRRPQPPASVCSSWTATSGWSPAPMSRAASWSRRPRGLWWPFPGGTAAHRLGARRQGGLERRPAHRHRGRRRRRPAPRRPPAGLGPVVTPRDLPPTVRKRVESSVVRSEVYPVPGGGRAVRRPPHPGPRRRDLVGTPGSRNPRHRSDPRGDYRPYQRGCRLHTLRDDEALSLSVIAVRSRSGPGRRSSWSVAWPRAGRSLLLTAPAARCRNSSTWAWSTPAVDWTVWLPATCRPNLHDRLVPLPTGPSAEHVADGGAEQERHLHLCDSLVHAAPPGRPHPSQAEAAPTMRYPGTAAPETCRAPIPRSSIGRASDC